MFVDREQELNFLNNTRAWADRGQMILLYGRRRVGKTELLRRWALGSGLSYTYWMADKEPPALQRRKLFARLFDVPLNRAIDFAAWSEFWEWSAPRLAEKRQILILDELPYAITADSAMLSSLQYAWDHSPPRNCWTSITPGAWTPRSCRPIPLKRSIGCVFTSFVGHAINIRAIPKVGQADQMSKSQHLALNARALSVWGFAEQELSLRYNL